MVTPHRSGTPPGTKRTFNSKARQFNAVEQKALNDKLLAASSVKTVRSLLEKGAEINALDNDQRNALMLACIYGHQDIALALIREGIDLKHKDADGKSAILLAAEYHRTQVLSALVAARDEDNAERLRKQNEVFMRGIGTAGKINGLDPLTTRMRKRK